MGKFTPDSNLNLFLTLLSLLTSLLLDSTVLKIAKLDRALLTTNSLSQFKASTSITIPFLWPQPMLQA
jgi:hypothetical protein